MVRTKWVSGIAALATGLLLVAGTAFARPLSVEVWTDRGDDAVYTPGEQMLVKARTNDDAYLLVYTIDAEGAVTVLYPFRRAAGMVEGRNTLRLPPESSGYELAVDNVTGQGFIVAIASRQPFNSLPWYLRPFDPQAESMGWANRHDDTEGFDEDGRVVGDPYVAIERIREAVLGRAGDDLEDFSTAYTSYYVGHEVRYPRYLCYDCHRPNQWAWWDGFDPYYTQCSVIDFRVNWNWCWGPCLWTAHTPYYYYTVRPNCPPRFRRWYDGHDRWSSWDGRRRWDDLWGGPLVRHKSSPPIGYIAPPNRPGDEPRTKPPGYITGPTTFRDAGNRRILPTGRNRPETGTDSRSGGGPVWRTPAGKVPVTPEGGGKGSSSGERFGGKDTPRFEPPRNTKPEGEASPRREAPRREPAQYNPPKQEQPRHDPPRYNPPPPREQPRQAPPRQEPPREQPRHESPKQEQPRQDKGSSGGGQKHRGGGGR